MSLRRLANSLGKGKEKSNGSSTSSTTSWSPSISQSHTPLSSSISLPENNLASNLQRYPSPVQSTHSSHSTGATYAQNAAPLRIVAPFAYNAPQEAVESNSSFGSNEKGDSETATLRLKRSLTKILGPKEEQSGHQYHHQKQSLSRKGSKDEGSAPEGGRRSRKGSLFGSSSHLEEKVSSSSDTPTPSSSGAKKIVSWIGQKQSGMTKKVQEALKSGGPSSLQAGMPKSKSRISSELHEDDDDDNLSSTSSAPSFVQTAPEEEPDIMPPLPMQAPFQIPTNVFLPRSHTNLHALTLASLAFPPSLHPLLYVPNLPVFPRSSNPPSKLPRLPTFRAHLAKTRILDRLEAQDLTPQENESILPFARQEEPPQPDPGPMVLMEDGESEEGRKITDTPGRSRGLEAWTRRLPALQRFRVWQPDNARYRSGDGDNIKYEPLSASTPYRTELVITGGTKALAGLVPSSPTFRDRESPNLPTSPARTLPTLSNINTTSLSLESFSSRNLDSPIIDESMLMDASDALPGITPTRAAPSASASPRPLPVLPGNRSADTPTTTTPAMAIQQVYWAAQEEEHSPIIPVRPLPPRPLPMPPSSPQITIDELESIDGPVIITTTVFTPKTSPRQSVHMSPQGSTNGHAAHTHNGMPSSSTITSAPHTPMDPLETASLRRMSMGSMSVVLSVATGFSLEEMDGLEVTTPHDLDSKRRSVASFKTSVHKRRSTASRASHASSPSLRNHPLPTLSESSRYSESSHLSSRPTYNGSTSPSTDGLPGRNHPSTSSGSGSAEQIPEDLPSPVAVDAPCMIADIKPEDSLPLEPSRTSHGHVDPFLIPQLSSLNTPNGKLDFGINDSSSPIFSFAEAERLLSSEPPVLSISVDVRTPTPPKLEQCSPSGPSGQTSPTSSMQSPVDSEYRYGIDGNRNSTSSAPVRFVKLKRSGSSADSGGTNGAGTGTTGGGRLQRTIKDPSKFWPHNRRVDENVEEDSLVEKATETPNHASWFAERESMQVAAAASAHIVDSTVNDIADLNDRPDSDVSRADTVMPHRDSRVSAMAVEAPASPSDISSLPPDLAFDVARLSDTSKLDLTLYTPQRSPPSSKAELPRRSASSTFSETESASRFADVKEIAATMSPVPSNRNGGHVRTPSSERAARIDAHLESVSASRYRPHMGTQPRPDFLPYPGHSRSDYGYSRQSRDGPSRSHSDGGDNPQSEDGSQASEDQPEDGLSFSPPPGYNISQQRLPVSRPPARWSEPSWKERQRSLNTLPLPSASISHSATRPLPFGHVLNRTGSIGGSSAPSIFRPAASKPGTIHGRKPRM